MRKQREKMKQNVVLFSFKPEYTKLKRFEAILINHFEKVYKYIKKKLKKKETIRKPFTQSQVKYLDYFHINKFKKYSKSRILILR